MSRVSHAIDRIQVRFDDENLVANAGLLLVGTLAVRLELEALVNSMVRLSGRVGGSRPGRKVMSLVHAIVAGGSHIDHADVLRCGGTEAVLPFRVMAPSTLGTFLRAFTFGHVRRLEAVVGETLRRVWSMGAGPGTSQLVIDVDSTICEVTGKAKQGAAFGYTKVLGYHPLLATRADTGEVLHARMRKGSANTQRGAGRFVDELVARVRRAGALGEIVIRFDSGFWSNDTIAGLDRLNVRYTMAVRTNNKGPAKAIAGIDEDAWVDIDYTLDGQAQVAECTYNGRRLIVRRLDRPPPSQAVARLASLRLPHRPRRRRGHPRRVPSPTRGRRARHPRPERRRRYGTRAVGQFQRQQRMVAVRGSGHQPDPLDRHPRRDRCRRPPHRRPHRSHAAHRAPRPARQPGRHHDPARPAQLALGRAVQPSPRPAPRTRTPDRLSAPTRHAHRTRVPARQPTTARTLGPARPRSRQQPLTSTSIDSDKRSAMNQPTPAPNR